MRNAIVGGIGMLWGGGMLLRWLLSGRGISVDSSYALGVQVANIFGLVMFCVGLYYLIQGIRELKNNRPNKKRRKRKRRRVEEDE